MPSRTVQERDFIAALIPCSLLDEAVDWFASNLNPGEIFPVRDLREWAEENGFVEDAE